MLSHLRLARLNADLTLFDIQRLTGIPMSRLSMLERRLVKPNDDERRRLATALNRNVGELFSSNADA